MWSWDGHEVVWTDLAPGDHIMVNDGVDADVDPLVPHFRPLLARTAAPAPYPRSLAEPEPRESDQAAWRPWLDLLGGDGLAGDDPRALIMRVQVGDRVYGSTSASLIGLPAGGGVRFLFTATPAAPDWYGVPVEGA